MADREISPNIYGIETEYSVMLRLPGDKVHEIVGQCHSADVKLGLYQEPSDSGGSHLDMEDIHVAFGRIGIMQTESGMLSNGGRFYMDPSGPEYDTPETATAEEAVHETFKGDRIVRKVLDQLIYLEAIEGYQLNRRIVDHNRSSRGIHLNTSTLLPEMLSDEFDEVYERMAALNVAKGSLFGSGGLLVNDHGRTEFHHSPRLSLTNAVTATFIQHALRPLVRTSFKPDYDTIRRIETISGDALNFAWPLRASMVVTNALTKLVELRRFRGLPRLASPIDAAHVVGKYGDNYKIGVLDKHDKQRTAYPSEVLAGFCEVALAVDTTEDYLDDESHQVLQEVIVAAEKIKYDPLSVATQVESVARFEAMQRKMAKERIGLDSERMCSFDYYWDKIDGGLAEKLRNKKLAGWQGFESTKSIDPSKKELATPPKGTRAYIRGDAIRHSGKSNNSGWTMIEDVEGDTFYIPPHATELPTYET